MLKETILCDRCKVERYSRRVSLLNGGTWYDFGSGRTHDDYNELELCVKCLLYLCRLLIREFEFDGDRQKKILEQMQKEVK